MVAAACGLGLAHLRRLAGFEVVEDLLARGFLHFGVDLGPRRKRCCNRLCWRVRRFSPQRKEHENTDEQQPCDKGEAVGGAHGAG